MYINGLPLVSNFNTKFFANDTILTLTNSCANLLNKNVNCELVKIDEWLKFSKLLLNTNKTKFMVLTEQKLARHFDIRIGKTSMEHVNEIKYLCVILMIGFLGSLIYNMFALSSLVVSEHCSD